MSTTVAQTIAIGREALRSLGDEGRFDALRLLEETLERDGAWLFAHGEEAVDDERARAYARALDRRAAGEPVAYIVGNAGFYGRIFTVTSAVLVPRPETELLIRFACEALADAKTSAPRICDVGTGSGILAITLACEIGDAEVTAIDLSANALEVARENAVAHGVGTRVRFVRGDVLAPLEAGETFDCLVANLPYIRSANLAPRPASIAREPTLALDGGTDGLEPYRRLLRDAPARIARDGVVLLEAGPDTTMALAELAAAAFGAAACVHVHRDYAGHPRVVDIRI